MYLLYIFWKVLMKTNSLVAKNLIKKKYISENALSSKFNKVKINK